FPMMITASLFGVIGIMVGMAVIIIHILSMESLGVPYGSPFSPLFASDLKDILLRLPWKIMKKRPLSLNLKQENRQRDIEETEEDK
uniref:spore germination protein n=1 Tax=Bacillus wiedmannii TaxID=1890302 RepID=UPI0034D7B298